MIFDFIEPLRYLTEGLIPRYPLPFSMPSLSNALERIEETIRMVEEFRVSDSLYAEPAPGLRVFWIRTNLLYSAIVDVHQDPALLHTPLTSALNYLLSHA